jgi:hypothetical protein
VGSVTKAVIFMPEEERSNIAMINRCFGKIARQGYVFDSIVSDWTVLMGMLRRKDVHVVVYARPDHIDPTWLPRFELADEEDASPAPAETVEGVPPSRNTSRRSRRPKRIR